MTKNDLTENLFFIYNIYHIKHSINNVLIKRKAGIESVEVNGHKLENIHDILEITNSADASSYKINGKH